MRPAELFAQIPLFQGLTDEDRVLDVEDVEPRPELVRHPSERNRLITFLDGQFGQKALRISLRRPIRLSRTTWQQLWHDTRSTWTKSSRCCWIACAFSSSSVHPVNISASHLYVDCWRLESTVQAEIFRLI